MEAVVTADGTHGAGGALDALDDGALGEDDKYMCLNMDVMENCSICLIIVFSCL